MAAPVATGASRTSEEDVDRAEVVGDARQIDVSGAPALGAGCAALQPEVSAEATNGVSEMPLPSRPDWLNAP